MAESSERIAKLLEKLKSNDSEVKVDAITKLQNEFTLGVQISDPEDIIAALKTSVRIPNQHIYTASLSAIAALLPVLVTQESEESDAHNAHDAVPLRHALLAFLGPGGIIDRLGDNREKPRESAREAVVSAGTVAFKYSGHIPAHSVKASSSGKVQETPLAIFERHLRDLGFGSKASRVREQSILALVHLRRTNSTFPFRSFLPHLVDTLEDSDGTVRDCARNSVVEIFTSPGVTDGARADLKKEMTKKNVRKGIVDGVLNQLLTNSGQMAEVQTPDLPPSGSRSLLSSRQPTASTLALSEGPSRTVSMTSSAQGETSESRLGEGEEVFSVYIASARDLEQEFATMAPPFEGRESEHNWQLRDRAVLRVRGMLKGDVHQRYPDAFLEGLKSGFVNNALKALASLRTTVATNACALYEELVHSLRQAYEPFVEPTLGALLRMGSLTKKIVAIRAQDVAKEILVYGHCHPRIVVPMLWSGIQDKNVQQRHYTLVHVQTVLENSAAKAKPVFESSGGLDILEKLIKKALSDPNAGIRDKARATFWTFHSVWKDRADVIAATLDAVARKQLDKAAPSGLSQLSATSSGTESKKSSVAAAIAASRAKARQIAADPPSLRHAATSHASTAASQARKATSPMSSPPGRIAMLPGANSKRMSGTFQRSSTSPAVVNLTSPSSATTRSNSSMSPPSSPTQAVSNRRQLPEARTSPPAPITSSSLSHPKVSNPGRPSLSSRSLSPPSATKNSPKRASGIFSPPKSVTRSAIIGANETFTLSPHPSDDESLMRVRAPHSDADGSDDESIQIASFSDAFGTPQKANSLLAELTPSTNPVKVPGPVVEDALRAQAEQAESAAERLLEELAEPDVTIHVDQPISLTSATAPSTPTNGHSIRDVPYGKAPVKPGVSSVGNGQKTPMKQHSEIFRQAAAYQDSPAYKKGTPLVLNMLKENRNESSWWLKRMALLKQGNQRSDNVSSSETLVRLISTLEDSSASKETLKELALLCSQNPVAEPDEGELLDDKDSIWQGGLMLVKLIDALSRYLTCDKDEEVLEYGLIVFWEIVENQQPYLEGREAELLSLLFQLRYSNKPNVAEASNTIRDAVTTRIDPVYGLTTVHSSLKKFLAQPVPEHGDAESRALSHAFGLLAIGKLILRLPQEILEEELPRLQLTLSQGLNDGQLLVREAAAAAITAAQLVLRDETYLFTLLASLTDEKKNLLTYLFDKHGARGAVEGVTAGGTRQNGLDRLEKEMSRLDRRTSTHQRRP